MTSQLSTDCILTIGYTQSILADLTRQCFYTVPTFENIDLIKGTDLFSFLLEEEAILEIPSNYVKNFTPLKLEYKSTGIVESVIIEYHFENIKKLETLGVQFCFFVVG